MKLAFALTLIAGQAAAQAGCPTNADLADGVRLTRNDPFFSIVLTQTVHGLEEARVMVQDGTREDVSSVYGHALAVTHRIGANGSLELRYADDPSALDDLPAIREWSTDVVLLVEGDQVNTGTYSARITGLGDAQVGTCSYTVWRVRDALVLEGSAPIMSEKSYAPDLGLVLAAIQLDPAGNPRSSVFFDQIAAE